MMLDLEEVRQRLNNPVANIKQIAKQAEIAYGTVLRVAHNNQLMISYQVVKKLSDYFLKVERSQNASVNQTTEPSHRHPGG